ncbi:MAG: diaminopimelate epimerase [bacterium]
MPTSIDFVKMHGLGNDFIVVDCIRNNYSIDELVKSATFLCDRNFGIGADGLILVIASTEADFQMRIINADGSEAEMCGNGIRCFAKFVYDKGLTQKTDFTVSTLAGIIAPAIQVEDGKVKVAKVNMGEPHLERELIPMVGPKGEVINEMLQVESTTVRVTAVSMGNPHAVLFVDDVNTYAVDWFGPRIERHSIFPRKTNVEFVQRVSSTYLKMRVWERGAGLTLACGTGACATVVAAVLNGLSERTAIVELPGGKLEITWDDEDNHVYMTGPADEVFCGVVTI